MGGQLPRPCITPLYGVKSSPSRPPSGRTLHRRHAPAGRAPPPAPLAGATPREPTPPAPQAGVTRAGTPGRGASTRRRLATRPQTLQTPQEPQTYFPRAPRLGVAGAAGGRRKTLSRRSSGPRYAPRTSGGQALHISPRWLRYPLAAHRLPLLVLRHTAAGNYKRLTLASPPQGLALASPGALSKSHATPLIHKTAG